MNDSEYHFSRREWMREVVKGTTIAIFILYLFYQNVFLVILLCIPFNILYLKKKKKDKAIQRRNRLSQDFKECVISLSTALSAGYSIENAFEETRKDLELFFEEDSDIMVEIRRITAKLRMNHTIEALLTDFALRSGMEDIINFAEIFVTAKRTGGDLVKIMKRTADNLDQKMEVNREIETMIAAKKLESRIMSVVPLAIIIYLWVFSPGYLSPLYHNVFGVLFMSAALGGYGFAYFLMGKIMNVAS